jgi:hypothetical protein
MIAALSVAATLALPAAALAQSSPGLNADEFPDLVPVAVWTFVGVLLVLAVVSVGYLYRRQRGLSEELPNVPISDMTAPDADTHLDAAGHRLSEHVVHEHAPAHHDDETEQAKLLHQH